MALVIGLTGGIASGKSAVSALFQKLNVPIIDTDVIAHQLTQQNGAAIPAIRQLFGNEFISSEQALDRNKMRQLVFTHSEAKKQLEALLHPLILEESQRQLHLQTQQSHILFVVPLLLQSPHFQECVGRVLVVDCAEEIRLQRLIKRGLNHDIAQSIIAQQSTANDLRAYADDLIINNGSLVELEQQVCALHKKYLSRTY